MSANKQSALEQLGFSAYRPLQEEAIDALLNNRDVVLAAPTGGGKSLVYQVAGLAKEGVAVIVSPLIALMKQQVEFLNLKSVQARFLNSTLNPGEQDDLTWSIRHNHIKFLYLSPEKLIQPSVIGLLQSVDIALFAIDEAHCIAQWGGYFRPEYNQLGQIKQLFPAPPIVALTGSADKTTLNSINQSLNLHNSLLLKGSIDRPNLQLQVAQKKQAKQQILYFLHHEVAGLSGIIYCRSRNSTEQLSQWLNQLGFSSVYYHAAMQDEAKNSSHKIFSEQLGTIMVATTAYGMGIDLPHIGFVIHMDLPSSPESYYQEIGRAGRNNQSAKTLLLYGLQDMIKAQQLIALEARDYFTEAQRLRDLFAIIESRQCRKQSLLAYFDEEIEECGYCDRCRAKQKEHNVTIAAQKLLSLIYHTRGTQAFSTLIQVLLGKRVKATKNIQAEKLSLFGQGKELSEAQWKSVIRHLLAFEYIQLENTQVFFVRLTEKARQILKGEAQLIVANDFYYPRLSESELSNEHLAWHTVSAWRHRKSVPLSDVQLRKICQHKPKNAASLSRLVGISLEEVNHFAESLLVLLHQEQSTSVLQ
ncbi:RecQ family ATP-dependent DNA helicase [Marinomonas sp. THO17]|uniref:RecQ family ATP-dependent DNA helicase n=1 Tax=Marinomonas sp. THO17 TaxID=3149048 RepID=UPI00336BCE85